MPKSAETPLSSSGSPSSYDDRVDALVRRRQEVEQRRFSGIRRSRAMLAFVAVWWLVPVVETLAGGVVAPMVLVFRLGLVLPWGLLVASP
ncbi:MAG: hypothetical protein GX458_22250, partial [Phyllobacteriaceae bacterium]|nr:hypothetical protein [Phyllobacteriaceae bacterium]